MHIFNGDSAAGCFKQAFHPKEDDVLVFRDVLSCGPLNTFVDMASWADFRVSYWTELLQRQGVDDIAHMHQDFYSNIERLKSADKVTVWLGCALSDQLMLAFIVFLYDFYELDLNRLEIRQFNKLEAKNITVIGLGILHPEQLKQLEPDSFKLNDSQISAYLATWDAVTAATPDKFMQLMQSEIPSAPLLFQSLRNLVYRYPDVETGLSRIDAIMLQMVQQHGPMAVRVVGYTLGQDMSLSGEDAIFELDTVGDVYLFERLKKMADPKLNQPLLTMNVLDKSMQETVVDLTPFGLEILAGEQNVIDTNGIDDWVGGVHLKIYESIIWYRNGEQLIN